MHIKAGIQAAHCRRQFKMRPELQVTPGQGVTCNAGWAVNCNLWEILEFAHNTEIPLLNYNNEADLTAVVNLVYLAARENYRVEREDKSGVGYVDFIFYPETDRKADGIILELKVDHTPEEALRQIKEKKYVLKFEGKLGEIPKYPGRVLGVGIAYDKDTKVHACKIEVLRQASRV